MMKLKEIFCPSLLVSESFYPLLTKEEELYDTVRKILLENYYSRIAGLFTAEVALLTHL